MNNAYKVFFIAYLRKYLSGQEACEVHDRLLKLARMYPVSLAYISGTESFFARFEFGYPRVAYATAYTLNGFRNPEKIKQELQRLEKPYEVSENVAYARLAKALLDGAGYEPHIQKQLFHLLTVLPVCREYTDIREYNMADSDLLQVRITDNLRNIRLYYTTYKDTKGIDRYRVLKVTPSTIGYVRRLDLQKHCVELFKRKLWNNLKPATIITIDKYIKKGFTYEQSLAIMNLLGN